MSNKKEMIFKNLKKEIANVLKIEETEILMDSRFKEDLGADSLDIMSLLMSLEEEYKEQIPPEESYSLTTVNAVVDYISNNFVKE